MFLVILTYTVPLDEIDALAAEHRAWLDQQYASGLFVGSGRRVPREGAVILCRQAPRDEVEAALANEPFVRAGRARYEIIEFRASSGPLGELAGDRHPESNGGNDTCVVIRPPEAENTVQGLPTFVGVSQESAGAQALCLHLVRFPPGGRAEAHLHANHESAIYIVRGEVEAWHGEGLSEYLTARAGDFIYVPAGVPHLPGNRSDSEPVLAVIARTDPNEQESVVLLPDTHPSYAG
jgi:uncharacterized RmlC-like cupin family protein/uncharacterized protein YciI